MLFLEKMDLLSKTRMLPSASSILPDRFEVGSLLHKIFKCPWLNFQLASSFVPSIKSDVTKVALTTDDKNISCQNVANHKLCYVLTSHPLTRDVNLIFPVSVCSFSCVVVNSHFRLIRVYLGQKTTVLARWTS